MKHFLLTLLLIMVSLLACRRDDVDIDQLTENPFDGDHSGAAIFEPIDTYVFTQDIPGVGVINRQAVRFRVRSDRFLPEQAGAPYQVFVRDTGSGETAYLNPSSPGTDVFIFLRDVAAQGVPVCLELRLSNNFSVARAETICVTL